MSWIDQVKQITRLVYDEDYPSLAVDTPVSPKKPRAPCAPSGDWQSLLRKKHVKPILHEHEHDELATFSIHAHEKHTQIADHYRPKYIPMWVHDLMHQIIKI